MRSNATSTQEISLQPFCYYVVDDCDTRTSTIAYYDGEQCWLPGSTNPHPPGAFGGEGRFHLKQEIVVPGHAYGAYKPEYGDISSADPTALRVAP